MSCQCANVDLNLYLPVGTAPSWTVTVIDPDTNDDAVNITGATFAFYAKESRYDDDDDAVFELTSGDSEITITSAANGQAQIDNTAAKSALLTAGRVYFWSLRITMSSGETRVVRQGSLFAQSA